MGNNDKNIPQTWKSRDWRSRRMRRTDSNRESPGMKKDDLLRLIHKVPSDDSPYVRAKQVQLIEKDPSKAIPLYRAAINSGDRVDSALKDMITVMKRLDRSDEAIEAIKTFRHLCSNDSQESIDNILAELYKSSGRIEEHIVLLQGKLKQTEEEMSLRRRTKIARSHGKTIQISMEQEKSKEALSLEADMNKQCNLAISLIRMNRFKDAKSLINAVRVSSEGKPMDESYAKLYERALQMTTLYDKMTDCLAKAKSSIHTLGVFCGDNLIDEWFAKSYERVLRLAIENSMMTSDDMFTLALLEKCLLHF